MRLPDRQRKRIHDLALDARELLTGEARELLEGTYGLYSDGRLDPPEKLPQVQADPETAETCRRLARFLDNSHTRARPAPPRSRRPSASFLSPTASPCWTRGTSVTSRPWSSAH